MKYLLILLTTLQIAHADVLGDINAYRKEKGLGALKQEAKLCKLAKVRVIQIQSDWSHRQFHVELDRIVGMSGTFQENLARTMTEDKVVDAWKRSKMGHNEAMLIPNMKIGCVASSKKHYVFEGYTE